MYTVSPETIKLTDSLAESKYGISTLTLMKNAAKACFDVIYPRLKSGDKIVVLCGKGNNGGDGYELCRILKKEWFDARAINVFDCEPATDIAKNVYKSCLDDGCEIISSIDASKLIGNADVIIDAVFGVGFTGCIKQGSNVEKVINESNKNTSALKIAIDVPSGINSGDGSVSSTAFKADLTVTLAFYKTGMLSYPAREYCGDIYLGKIGIPKELCDFVPKDALIPDDEYLRCVLPKREQNSHKGSFGRLMMFCASEYMTGAGILAATAALRSGVGLVNIARDKETLKILQCHLTEPIFTCCDTNCDDGEKLLISCGQKASAILIGCGLGQCENDKKAVYSLIKNSTSPIILDADGINAVSENIIILKEAKKEAVLTPHPLEFSRLTGKSVSDVQGNRISLARDFATEHGCVIVLKGAATVIASPDGRLAICTCGNSGLAKGGSGDVLAGLCASLRAQGMSSFDSAVSSVYLHAKAADILSQEISQHGMLPSDLPMAIAKLLP